MAASSIPYYQAKRRKISDKLGEIPSVVDLEGSYADAELFSGGSAQAGSATFASSAPIFRPDHVGKMIAITLAGERVGTTWAGDPLYGTVYLTVKAFLSNTEITLSGPVTTTVSNAQFVTGTNSLNSWNQAIMAFPEGSKCLLKIPMGNWLTYGTLQIGLRRLTIQFDSGTWYAGTSLFAILPNKPGFKPVGDGGSVRIQGCGHHSEIVFLQANGYLMEFNTISNVSVKHLSLKAIVPNNQCIGAGFLSCSHDRISDCLISGFYGCIETGGTSNPDRRGTWHWLTNIDLQDFTGYGLWTYHTVEMYITNLTAYAVLGEVINPTKAWGVIIDTDTSGVNATNVSLGGCGMIIRDSLRELNERFGAAPEWLYFDKLICDSTRESCLKFDASLEDPTNPDVPARRKGRSYFFTNLWAAFSQEDGTPCIDISGGDVIYISLARVRVGRLHGIWYRGGDHVVLHMVESYANNQQNAANGSGLLVDELAGDIQVSMGRYSNPGPADGGNQKYGIYRHPNHKGAFVIG